MRSDRLRLGILGLVFSTLAACDMTTVPSAPDPNAQPAGPLAPDVPSARSQALARYYAQVEADLLGRGLMRTDGGGPDTPYTDTDLMRNFEQIVFYDEYAPGAGYRPSSGRAGALRKWTGPIRFGIEFGPSVPETRQVQDRRLVEDYVARLARITRHPISMSPENANFHVLFTSEDDRETTIARIREIVPNIGESTLSIFRTMPRSIHCLVVAFSGEGDDHTYRRAIALIRAEHPPLLRQSCVHEELAQGLGLADDSPAARPSIFNDDDEFALLTRHDEELLRLLYNPALTPGMRAEDARPILRRLLEARGGGPV